MDYVQLFDKNLNQTLSGLKSQSVIKGVIHLLLALYVARLAPELPKEVTDLFGNQYFRLFIFALVLWTAQFSPSTSILIALAFMVSMNYATQKPLWEFLENTQSPDVVTAPSKDIAVAAATSIVNAQAEETPVVSGVSTNEQTIVIQPSIVETPQGPAVVQPSVVLAPVVVQSSNGEQMVIHPEVSSVAFNGLAAGPAPSESSYEAVPAPAPEAAPEAAPAPAPEAAPEPSPAPPAVPVQSKEPQAQPAEFEQGCYPLRRYDMQKVSPQSMDPYREISEWSA
jgi:hypothetical protein